MVVQEESQVGRRWGLRRWVVLGGMLFLGLLALRWGWGWVAGRLLEKEVRKIEGREEPIRAGDLGPGRVVDDARNAAVLLSRAGAMIVYTAGENRWAAGFTGRGGLSAYDVRVLGGIVKENQRSLDMARRAREESKGVDWKVRGRRPAFNDERKLAMLLCNGALYEHALGRDAEAVGRVRDALFLSRMMEWKGAMLVTHESAVGVATMACQTIEEMAPTLREEARGEVRGVIGELLDERGVEEGMVRGLWGKRMADLVGGEAFGREVFRAAGYWALRPMVVLDTRGLLREDGEVIGAAGAGSYPAAVRGLPPGATDARVVGAAPHLEEVARAYSEGGRMQPEMYVRMEYLHLLDRRVAAVALAVRLWRLDHGGAWPEGLGDLVPGYLAGVPGDPMARGGKRLGYVRRGRGAVVYSVGMNGSDEGGDGRPYDPKNVSGPRTLRYDMVYPLGRSAEN